MNTAHTPGPWEADIHMGNNGYTIADMIEPSICEMVSVHSPEETKANARLIAAAPELLTALDEMVATHELREHKGEKITPLQRRAVEMARAAIAKAKGQA